MPVSLTEVNVPAAIPPEWGTLRNALPLAGNPAFYALFFEDAVGSLGVGNAVDAPTLWLHHTPTEGREG